MRVNVMSETIQSFLELLDEFGTNWLLDAALRALGEVLLEFERPRINKAKQAKDNMI